MTVRSPIRVCIIEDHAIVRAGIKMLLDAQSDIEVVGEAVDRKTALEIAARECPDVFLVDIRLGGGSAVDFLEELLAVCEASAILLTGLTDREEIHRAIKAGAIGLVYKDEDPEVLLRAIRKVYAGEGWLARALMTSALSRLTLPRRTNTTDDNETAKISRLTPREREVIGSMASGLNRKKTAEKLFVSEATVRNHLTAIFGKLDIPNRFELVFYARRYGLGTLPGIGGANSLPKTR